MRLKWLESTEQSDAGPRKVWRSGDYRITKDDRRGSPHIACHLIEREFANTMRPTWNILHRGKLPECKAACQKHSETVNHERC